jgi:hypothetical protein
MGRSFAYVCAVTFLVIPAWSAHAATASTPTGDFVVGGGTTATFFLTTEEAVLPVRYQNIVVDAHSGPSGANANGTVSFQFAIVGSSIQVLFTIGGPVTCLRVTGNDALIGFTDVMSGAGFGPSVIHVIDNGSSGSPPDEFFSDPIPTTCGAVPNGLHGGPLASGDIVVHDAVVPISKQQCYRGGWRHVVDDTGTSFRNQGACIAFVATPTSS